MIQKVMQKQKKYPSQFNQFKRKYNQFRDMPRYVHVINLNNKMNVLLFLVLSILFKLIANNFSFQSTEYFATHQLRLQPSLASSMLLYTLPIQPIPNTVTAALALSGYDLAPNQILSFSVQLGYDPDGNCYEIIFRTNNGTQVYFINYFLIQVGSSAANWIFAQSYCINTSYGSNSPATFNRIETFNFITQFLINTNDSVRVIPYINSATIFGADSPNFYFNVSSTQAINQTYNISIQIYRNYSYFMSACLTIVMLKQTYLKNQPLMAYSYNQLYSIENSDNTLTNAINKQFQISYFFGPTIQPKCVIAFRAFLIDGNTRQSLVFDISQSSVTGSNTNLYSIDFSVLCIGYVTCPSPNDQFYPLIASCQPACSIDSCLTCSSSTSCIVCNSSYFIDPLSRCSPCISNCLSCTDSRSCKTCAMGYYYANQFCQQCAIYCLECVVGSCSRCAQGYTPNGTNCVSCQVAIPKCLKCTGPASCSSCVETFVFFTNNGQCVTCSSLMPNCLTCNWPNNCLTCMTNYYLFSFKQCSLCTHKIDTCCPNYVPNCTVCASNTTCSICQIGYFVNTNQTCSFCNQSWHYCATCDKTACATCQKGYFIINNTCIQCNTAIPNCKACFNSSICQLCQSPLIFADGQCINCPIWPLNGLYYIQNDNGTYCQPCSQISPQCTLCNKEGICLSCKQTYYLSKNDCFSCNNVSPFCMSCRNGNGCAICKNSYFLNISNTKECLACSSVIRDCLTCLMKIDQTKKIVYSCSICLPQYYAKSDQCFPCNTSLRYCLNCKDAATCSECQLGYFSINGKCMSCRQLITGCVKCNSSSKCLQCSTGYIIQGSFCTSCQTLMSNCQICTMNKSLLCLSCLQGYFMGQNSICQICSTKYKYCTTCDQNKCLSCLTSFSLNSQNICRSCNSIIPNCAYCDHKSQCRSCSPNFILNSKQNQCLSCQNVQKGCQQCIQLSVNSTDINCSSCAIEYILNNSKCLLCQNIIPLCKQCLSLNECQQCLNTSFINQGKCSLCSLTIPNCMYCSNNSNCQKCISNYVFGSNNNCILCPFQKLGTDQNNKILCKECVLTNQSFICLTCDQMSYLNSTVCISCSKSILNCLNCINGQKCTKCINNYYLNSNGTQCSKCNLANCVSCSKDICLQCSVGYVLVNKYCVSCSTVFNNCSICTQNSCSICSDGYYSNGRQCSPCSTISQDCVICNDPKNCLVSSPFSSARRSKTISMAIGITGIVASVLLFGILIFYFVRLRLTKKSQLEDGGSDTSRRMNENGYASNDIQIQRNLCLCCNVQKASYVKLQLLCRDCDLMQGRGASHKITKIIGKQPQDCILQKSLQIESKYEERNSPIQKQKLVDANQNNLCSNQLSDKFQQNKYSNYDNSSKQKVSYLESKKKPNTIKKNEFYHQMF